ncbi:MAG: hypothetical protein GY771_02315 [bacterium]|nr:hypothetical protein [bacterium]
MTMLVGIKRNDGAIIFADTRLSLGTSRFIHLDGFSKVYCLRNGFVAAAGIRSLTGEKIRALRRARARNGATDYVVILNRPYVNLFCVAAKMILGLKSHLMTLTRPVGGRNFAAADSTELYLFSENGGYKPRERHNGYPAIVWPYNLSEDIRRELAIKYFSGADSNNDETVRDTIGRITEFYAETAQHSPYISPGCRFAVFATDEDGNARRGIGYSRVSDEGDIVRRFANLPEDFNYRGWLRPRLVERYLGGD